MSQRQQGTNDFAKNLVANRARRCSATILTWLENNVYDDIPPEKHSDVRRTILSNVNDLSDIAIDIVKSDTGQINEFWVEELAEIKSIMRSEW